MTATSFMQLCDEIQVVSSPYNAVDVSRKSLSTLLNEMTSFVARAHSFDNDDETIVFG